MNQSLRQRTRETLDRLRGELLDLRTEDGHWVGELSPSALSTATAVSAMSAVLIHGHGQTNADRLRAGIGRGIDYLRNQQNEDGGFGDTDRSHSNIATSYLVLAASALADQAIGQSLSPSQLTQLESYIESAGAIDGLRQRYGKDKTFVVPILANMAIAGLVSWNDVAALPFEAAVFPQSMYRLLSMPVVSYAIPALVAIGQARHFHGRKALWPLRMVRAASISRTMKVLSRMQPDSGGYLEATPLTSFVVMNLAVTKRGDHEVSQNGLRFVLDSMQADGSWPIDTNLATWVTSLSIHALACDPEDDGQWCNESLVRWNLSCQHRERHPFTGAEPGGWGWSDLSGAVPDSDDTPAAILALLQQQRWVDDDLKQQCDEAIDAGVDWLRKLQNRDGGWPTFCRGWGKLPFDRSSNDLTAHALRALLSRRGTSGQTDSDLIRCAKACRFLEANQQEDGSWLPLWFGNQDRDDESNPVYGTSRVLVAGALGVLSKQSVRRGCGYLVGVQNRDGGWGGGPSVSAWMASRLGVNSQRISSVEETALAVDALATVLEYSQSSQNQRNPGTGRGVESGCLAPEMDLEISTEASKFPYAGTAGGNEAYRVAIIRGVEFLLESVADGHHRLPWPIGFYFAKLWYHERLYPLIFTTTALGKYLRATAEEFAPDWPR